METEKVANRECVKFLHAQSTSFHIRNVISEPIRRFALLPSFLSITSSQEVIRFSMNADTPPSISCNQHNTYYLFSRDSGGSEIAREATVMAEMISINVRERRSEPHDRETSSPELPTHNTFSLSNNLSMSCVSGVWASVLPPHSQRNQLRRRQRNVSHKYTICHIILYLLGDRMFMSWEGRWNRRVAITLVHVCDRIESIFFSPEIIITE